MIKTQYMFHSMKCKTIGSTRTFFHPPIQEKKAKIRDKTQSSSRIYLLVLLLLLFVVVVIVVIVVVVVVVIVVVVVVVIVVVVVVVNNICSWSFPPQQYS